MGVSSVAASVTVMQQSVEATHLQLALLKKNVEIQTDGLLKVLETTDLSSGKPPHLGNLIDTTA